MKINKTKPPKNREFLGLVKDLRGYPSYLDFFDYDCYKEMKYLDRDGFEMPEIVGWVEVPELEVE